MLFKRIKKVRADLQSSLGFQPLFEDTLDDVQPILAIQFPQSIYSNIEQRELLTSYVVGCFSDNELNCEDGTYKEVEIFDVNIYGSSRFTALILHNIWIFRVGIKHGCLKEGVSRHIPNIPTWSVIEINYDDLKIDKRHYIGYYTYEYIAVLNSENKLEAKRAHENYIIEEFMHLQMQSV